MGTAPRSTKGVRTVLDEKGYHYRLIEKKNQDTFRQAIQETDSPGGGRITIIALDVQSLDQATRILEENTIYQGRVAGTLRRREHHLPAQGSGQGDYHRDDCL